jgi:hypothetical protein
MKYILIIILALVISLFVWAGFLGFKRNKLLQAWESFAKSRGVTLPTNYIRMQLDKLGNRDLNVLIDFSVAVQDQRYLSAAGLLPQVKSILTKTASLNDIGVLLGEMLQGKLGS